MIKYKISNTPVGNAAPRSHDIQLYNAVDDYYEKYNDAPREYKIRYNFIFHALYSCITFCSKEYPQDEAFNKFKEFALKVEFESGLHIKPIKDEKGTISFKVDRKDKVKRYKQNG